MLTPPLRERGPQPALAGDGVGAAIRAVGRSEPRSGNDRVGNQGRFCNIVGGVISPILSNLVLDRLDKYVEAELIPTYSRGPRRKTNPPYVALTVAASRARKRGDRE